MATRTISTRLAVEGESQYKQAIANINAEIGNLSSKLKLAQSEFQNHQNSMAALQAKSEALAKVQEAQSKAVDTLKAAYSNAKAALETYEKKTDTLKTALKENETALSSLDGKTREAGQEWAKYSSQAADAEKKLDELRNTTGDTSSEEEKLQATIDKARSKMQDLEKETDGAAKTAGELILEQKSLNSELEKSEAGQEAAAKACNNWEKKLNTAQIQLNNTNAQIELNDKYLQEASESADQCAQSIDEFGKEAKEAGNDSSEAMGSLATLLASAGIADLCRDAAKALNDCAVAAGEFHAQMSTVESISGASSEEMKRLIALAKEMGATTQFTANQSGEAMEYMAMAGWDASKMMDGLAGIMNLAAASGEDLGTASDIATDALTAFKMQASESGHFSDILAQTSASANTNVSLLGESFKYVAPLCGTLGYSAEDASIALGLMANAGIKGSQAGTSLKTALANLSAPTDKQAAMMDKLGISLTDSSGTMLSLREIMGTLRQSFSELDSVEQTAAASTIFGKEAMSGMLNIINASDEDYAKLTKSIDNCSGAAERMAAIRLDNYQGQLTLLESATEGLSIAIGEALTPALGNVVEAATEAASAATEFVSEHPQVVAAITAIISVAATLTAGITGITVVIPALVAAFETVTVALSANPFGLAVTAAAALAAGIVTLTGVMSAQAEADNELQKSADVLTEQINKQKEAYEALTEENSKTAEHNEALASSLDNLLSKTEKEVSDHEKIKYVVEQLNEAIPGLSLAYDSESESINMTTEELNKYLDAASKQSQYDSDVERMNELYAEQAQIQDQLTEAQRQLMDAQVEAEQATQKYGEAWAYSSEEYQNANNKAIEINKTIEDLTQKQEENSAALAEAEEKVNSYAASTEDMSGSNITAADSLDGIVGSAEDVASSIKELDETYVDAKNSAMESIQKQISLWDEAADVTATSADDMISALESQKKYWNDYGNNIENVLSRNVDGIEMFVQHVDDGSEKAASYIAGMADMSDEELQQLVDAYVELMDEQDRVATNTADLKTQYSSDVQEIADNTKAAVSEMNLEEEAKQAGEDTMQGYSDGLTGKQEEVNTKMAGIATGVKDVYQTEMDSHSPSKVFEGFGKDTIQGYINGVDAKSSSLLEKMGETAQAAIEKFFGISNEESLTDSGSGTIQGFISGVTSKADETLNTMKTAATKAVNKFSGTATKDSLPGAGKNTIQGYINGVDSKNDSLTSKMQKLAQNAINKFSGNATKSSLSSSGKNSIQGYIDGASGKKDSLTTKMKTLADSAIKKYKDNATNSSLSSAGENTLQGYINGLNNKASSLYTRMMDIAQSAIRKFKDMLGISSPSKVFKAFGVNSMEGYEQGNESKVSDLVQLMQSIAKRVSNSFSSHMKLDDSPLEDLMDSGIEVVERASEMETGYASVVKKMAQRAIESFQEVTDSWNTDENNILQSYIEKITIQARSLYEKMEEIAKKATEVFQVNFDAAWDFSSMSNTIKGVLDGYELDFSELQSRMDNTLPSWNLAYSGNSNYSDIPDMNTDLLQEQNDKLESLYQIMKIWLPKLANMKMVLDKDTVIGEFTPGISAKIEEDYQKSKRGG